MRHPLQVCAAMGLLVAACLSVGAETVEPSLRGAVSRADGSPALGATVRLERAGRAVALAATDAQGRYRLAAPAGGGVFDLVALYGDLAVARRGVRLQPGQDRVIDLILREEVSIAGRVLHFDNDTPHRSVVVEALRAGEVVRKTLTDGQGQYRFTNLRPGPYRVRLPLRDGAVVSDGFVQVAAGRTRADVNLFAPTLKRGTWKHYTYLDGLGRATVQAIYQSNDGFMWFSSERGGGMSRFDGAHFDRGVWPARRETIRYITGTPDGALWAGSLSELQRFKDGHLSVVDLGLDLPVGFVRAIEPAADGGLWFGIVNNLNDRETPGGLYYYKEGHTEHFTTADGLPDNAVTALFTAADGALWVGTRSGLARYMDGEFTTYIAKDGLPGDQVTALHAAPGGGIWIATTMGLARYTDGRFAIIGVGDGLTHNVVTAIDVAADGVVWIGTSKGLTRYQDGYFTHFDRSDGLAKDKVIALHAAADGGVWLSTQGGGVTRYDERGIHHLGRRDGLPEAPIFAMERDAAGVLWLGTRGGGLAAFANGRFTTYTTDDGLPHDSVVSLLADADSSLWVGTERGGIGHRSGGRFTTYTTADGLALNDVWALERDRAGALWAGTRGGGLSRLSGGRFTTYAMAEGLPRGEVQALHADADGRLWVGLAHAGLALLRGRDGEVVRRDTTLSTIEDLYRDRDGQLWAVTLYRGVWRVAGESLEQLAAPDGPAAEGGASMHQLADGSYWFGGWDRGVAGFDGTAWTALDARDGLSSNIVTEVREDASGALLFATYEGLIRYERNPTPPGVYIASVQSDSLYADLAALPPLRVGERAVIASSAIDFKTVPQKRHYRYRLRRADEAPAAEEGWGAPAADPHFAWTPQEAGAYVFEVQAIDRDLNYSAPAALVVEVVLPWFRNLWITGSLGGTVLLAFVAAGFFGLRYSSQRREAQALREQMLRQEQAARRSLEGANSQLAEAAEAAEAANQAKSAFLANMSHEIRTPLNAILGYARLLRRRDLGQEIQQPLRTIEQSGEHLLSLINDILDLSKIEADRIELEQVGFDLRGLVGALGAMFEVACREKGVAWHIEWAGDAAADGTLPVSGDEAKLRQVLINLVGNAVKFTTGGEVRLRVARGDGAAGDRYRFEVLDTGPGIHPDDQARIFQPFEQSRHGARAEGTGLGLAISRRFVELMGGALELESAPGAGARFFFTVSLPESAEALAARPAAAPQRRVVALAPGHSVDALVVDDIAENRQVLGQTLEMIGVAVRYAAHGEEAVAQVAERMPDIVLMDIWMPVMDGVGAVRALRRAYGSDQPKIVAVTASVLQHEREEYLGVGFDLFLGKPVAEGQLFAALAELLGIAYRYEDDVEAEATLDWSSLALPEPLLARLRQAADYGHLTELEALVGEVERLDPAYGLLAEECKRLLQRLDLDQLQKCLRELKAL